DKEEEKHNEKRTTEGMLYFRLLILLLYINSLPAYSLKNCTILYQENPSADFSLDCAHQYLVTIPHDLPKNTVSLQLQKNLVEKISKDDFYGMSKLKFLDLRQNKIAYVDNGSFVDLDLLKTLIMRCNSLNDLPSNMFQGLSNLTVLDLKNNFIGFIHRSTFRFLISLQELDLGSNKLKQIRDIQPILQLPQLQRINLECNQFSSFETNDLLLNFSSNLKALVISSSKMKHFSITTPVFPYLQMIALFSGGQHPNLKWEIPDKALLRNITHLYLKQSALSFKEIQNILQSLDSLRHLRLNFLNRWIRRGLLSTVCKIPTLKVLDLFQTHLDTMTHQLAPCSQLIKLDLRETYINELPKGSLQSMKKLKSLNVSHNQLTKVPYDIRSLTSLQILNMGYNSISKLSCEDFVNATHLTELYLNTNRITKLCESVFDHLADLKLLDVSNNLLQTFGDTFQVALQKLEVLDLSHNFIRTLEDGDFQGLQSLKQLNVASDHFKKVKGKTFQGLNDLQDLIVSLPNYEPNFKELQNLANLTIYTYGGTLNVLRNAEGFVYLKSMKSLTVICNSDHSGIPLNVPKKMLQAMKHLEHFKAVNIYINAPEVDTFQVNPQLKSLTLTRTDLSDLKPELFLPIPSLQKLDLSKSELKSLGFLAQANLTALRYLKLTSNEITVINDDVLSSLPSLIYLDLSINPFTCDCLNAEFIQWIKNNKQTQVVNAHRYKCSFPVDRRGTLLLDFNIQSCWNDGSFFYFISSTCLVVLTLLTSFIYHFLRWQLAYTFHLFLAFVYDSRRRKKGDPHQFDAFVSYNVHDEDWVYREMLPVLEGEQGWRLCLHHRDFQPGKPIMENITDAIYGSRKTICVISRHYLQSEWCSREIQMASFRLFDEQKDVLILLFLEDIPSRHLSPYYRMRKLVKKRTYLSWPQAAQHPGVFWQNVQRALQTGDALTEETDLLTGPAGP
uniref:Toll-like receptor 13 n=1 Tax=Kryptolebias marmoratus TaxID=37003 RepID=A0A3Q3BJN7_KRYMA